MDPMARTQLRACLRSAIFGVAALSVVFASTACSRTTTNSDAAAAESAERAIAVKDFKTADLPRRVPVAFRLDDVMAKWCSACLTNIYNTFAAEKVPLSVGVIGKDFDSGAAFDQQGSRPPGTQMTLDAMSQFRAAGVPFEISSHSYSHPALGMPSLGDVAAQSAELAKAQHSITTALGVTPTNFIPPTNRVDAATYAAMAQNGLTSVSGQCSWPHTNTVNDWAGDGTFNFCSGESTTGGRTAIEMDGHLPENTVAGIRTVPAGVVIDSWSDFAQPANLPSAYGWIKAQYDAQGFAVIMLHPRELAADRCEGGSNAALNEEKVAAIKAIIAKGKELNWTFTTLTGLSAT